jgi:hypothetical protein
MIYCCFLAGPPDAFVSAFRGVTDCFAVFWPTVRTRRQPRHYYVRLGRFFAAGSLIGFADFGDVAAGTILFGAVNFIPKYSAIFAAFSK